MEGHPGQNELGDHVCGWVHFSHNSKDGNTQEQIPQNHTQV